MTKPKTATATPYQTVKAEADRLGLPTSFRDDLLVHDARVLDRPDAPQQFVWAVRTSGTDLMWAPDVGDDLHTPTGAEKWLDAMIKHNSNLYYYAYDRGTFTPITPERALTWLRDLRCELLDASSPRG